MRGFVSMDILIALFILVFYSTLAVTAVKEMEEDFNTYSLEISCNYLKEVNSYIDVMGFRMERNFGGIIVDGNIEINGLGVCK